MEKYIKIRLIQAVIFLNINMILMYPLKTFVRTEYFAIIASVVSLFLALLPLSKNTKKMFLKAPSIFYVLAIFFLGTFNYLYIFVY